MFNLDSDNPKKSFHEIVNECYPDGSEHINEAETLHWNKLKRKEKEGLLNDVGFPKSFAKEDWKELDFRAKEKLGKYISKSTEKEYALKETATELFDSLDAKTIALYNKAKEKAVKLGADAKSADSAGGEAPEEKKEECPSGQKMVDGKCADETNEESPVAPDADGATEKVTTYKGKKPKKAIKTLFQPGNGKDSIQENNNMENGNRRSGVNPFGEQDKLATDMTDILKDIRANDVVTRTPAEFETLAKDVAETHKTSDNNLRTDIMDTLRGTKKLYSNKEINNFEKLVQNELVQPSSPQEPQELKED
jgi:hypothetical protein